jgi:hypothetical protein
LLTFRYDALSIKQQSFWLDLKLIALSFWIIFRGTWEYRGKTFEARGFACQVRDDTDQGSSSRVMTRHAGLLTHLIGDETGQPANRQTPGRGVTMPERCGATAPSPRSSIKQCIPG